MRSVVFVCCALILGASLVFADAPRTGVVTGTVVGPDDTALPGATVQIQGGRGTQTAVTKADGSFKFVFLPPGQYTVRADLPGFQSAQGEITVSAGGRAAVALQLSETMGEEILVTGETPLVNKYDVTAGGTISSDELATVPTTERNFMQALAVLPGVDNDASSLSYGGYQPNVEGSRGARVAYHMDGVDMTFSRLAGGTRMMMPSFAMAEVKMESSAVDAQYGRSTAGVVSTVLKSGTNELHGQVLWNGRNLDWDSNYDLTPVVRPDELNNYWELSLGGPIVKDKLWFFVAYADTGTAGAALLGDGQTVLDTGIAMEMFLGKLDWRPRASHTITGTYVDFPYDLAGYVASCADLGATWLADWPQEFWSLNWDWAASDSVFVETRVASQTTNTNRLLAVDDASGPDPWRPSGNNSTYNDLLTPLMWNGPVAGDLGTVGYPRDQANVSANWFAGAHDVKAGIDYQAVEEQSSVKTADMALGRGYNPDAPGGFTVPLFYREFYGAEPGQVAVTPAENWAIFVRDRMSFNRWTFNLGLRYDWQKHENDVGQTTVDAKDISPRLNAVYDVGGDGTLLLSASTARYVYQFPQNWSGYFSTVPGGRTYYDQYGWNAATQAYDIFQRTIPPPTAFETPTPVDPHNKDEFTIGADWAFHADWALKAKLLYWEQKEMAQIYNQLDDQGQVVRVIENNPWAESERKAFHLSIQRRFKDNWMIAGSYTWSETEGNCIESVQGGTGCEPAPGRLIDLVNPDTGEPWSLYNAYGPLDTDRPHSFKLRGLYRLPMGKGHSLTFGGSLFYQSGEPWARTENIDVLDGTETMTIFAEPRGSNRNPFHKELSLSFEWQFPIVSRVDGGLRLDVVNVTNEQELVGTTGLAETGEPTPSTLNYQTPRYFRVSAKITF